MGASSPVRIGIRTSRRIELQSITAQVRRAAADSGVAGGLCVVYVPHTTAGITINEDADPDVAADIEAALAKLVPQSSSYRHSEGNSDAHVKASLIGPSVAIPIDNGALMLGRWQGIFFCEFDGPRSRSVYIKILEG